jgi:hypothetical protein
MSWAWLRDTIDHRKRVAAPSRRTAALEELGPPVAAVLESTAGIGSADLRNEIVGFLCDGDDQLVSCLVSALVSSEALPSSERRSAGFDVIARHCVAQLRTRLARPPRSDADWSIELPGGCDCELCAILSEFLGDPDQPSFEWPLAKEGRRHVHSRLDTAELPVRHQTRRTGRPFTLVLVKTEALFEGERRARATDRDNLAWLDERWAPASRHRRPRGKAGRS